MVLIRTAQAIHGCPSLAAKTRVALRPGVTVWIGVHACVGACVHEQQRQILFFVDA